MKHVFSVLLYLVSMTVFAENRPDLDVRSVSLGHVHALSSGVVNPSSLSFCQVSSAGLSVYNQFQIEELNTFSSYGIFPNKLLDTGLQITEYGYDDYHLWTFLGSFSKKITSEIALGTSIRYQKVTGIIDESVKPLVHADIGLFFRLNEKIDLAFLAEDALNNAGYNCKSSAGINYAVSASCNLLLECTVQKKEPVTYSSGIEYELMDHFYFRAGLYTNPLTPTFGVSFSLDPFTIDVACDKHQVLGYSTMLGISYQF